MAVTLLYRKQLTTCSKVIAQVRDRGIGKISRPITVASSSSRMVQMEHIRQYWSRESLEPPAMIAGRVPKDNQDNWQFNKKLSNEND